MWINVAVAALMASVSAKSTIDEAGLTTAADRVCATSANFTVHSFTQGPNASQVAATCERLRAGAVAKWLAKPTSDEWRPQCVVVLHRSRSRYVAAVGRAASNTRGSSLVTFDRGHVKARRIDLLADRNEVALSALAHELTHIVLADAFGARQAPLWADEGMATLADSSEKRQRHQRDLLNALRRGHTIPLAQLFTSESYPHSAQWGAFYGQSISVVAMLTERRAPHEFVRFIELSHERGYDRALREVYEIEGVAQLEQLWRWHAMR